MKYDLAALVPPLARTIVALAKCWRQDETVRWVTSSDEYSDTYTHVGLGVRLRNDGEVALHWRGHWLWSGVTPRTVMHPGWTPEMVYRALRDMRRRMLRLRAAERICNRTPAAHPRWRRRREVWEEMLLDYNSDEQIDYRDPDY